MWARVDAEAHPNAAGTRRAVVPRRPVGVMGAPYDDQNTGSLAGPIGSPAEGGDCLDRLTSPLPRCREYHEAH